MKEYAKSRGVPNKTALFCLFIVFSALLLGGADQQATSLFVSVNIFALMFLRLALCSDWRIEPWTFGPLALWCLLMITHYLTGRSADAEHEYLMLLSGGCIFVLGQNSTNSRTKQRWFHRYLVGAILAYSFYAFLQHFMWPESILFQNKSYHIGRLTGSLLSANSAATLFALFCMYLIFRLARYHAFLIRHEPKTHISLTHTRLAIKRPFAISTLLFSLSNLILTGSRSGMAAFLMGLSAFYICRTFYDRNQKSVVILCNPTKSVSVILVLALFLVIWIFSGSLLESRMGHIHSDVETRMIMWEAAWKAGNLEPILGHGLGGFKSAITSISTAENYKILQYQGAAHNLFVQWFVQAGWPGVIGLLTIIIAMIILIIRRSKTAHTFGVLLSFIVIIITHGLFDYALEIPAIFLFSCFTLGALWPQD